MDDDEWVTEQDQLVEIERERYNQGRNGGGGGGAAVAAQNADPRAPFQEALVKEFTLYDRHRLDVMEAARQVPPNFIYGDPLLPDHPLHYEYWPSKMPTTPILFQGARIILCPRNHSMGNERDHSLMGRLFSKARASLQPGSLEDLVLGHHYLMREHQADKHRYESMSAAGVDPQMIEDDFEARMEGVFARHDGAAVAGSDSEGD